MGRRRGPELHAGGPGQLFGRGWLPVEFLKRVAKLYQGRGQSCGRFRVGLRLLDRRAAADQILSHRYEPSLIRDAAPARALSLGAIQPFSRTSGIDEIERGQLLGFRQSGAGEPGRSAFAVFPQQTRDVPQPGAAIVCRQLL